MSPKVGLGTGEGTRGWDLWIISVVMVIVAGLFVAARLTQKISKRHMGLDDYLILASLISSVILSITEIEAVKHGYGRRYKELTPAQAVEARKWFYGAQVAYKFVLTFNKMSICHMIYRIFNVSSHRFRRTCHAVQAFIFVSGVAYIIGTFFQCTPVRAFWNKSIEHKWCFNQKPWWISYAALQILLDFVLLALPVRQVLKLQMSRLERFGLILVFCTGLFVTFTSIYRATTLAASATNPDPTYGPIPATVWTVIEANSGIITACLPPLRQPFVRIFGHAAQRTRPTSTFSSASLSRRLSRQPFGNEHAAQSQSNTIVASQHRESEEQMVSKDGNIYVSSDIRITSMAARSDDSGVKDEGRHIEMT